MAEMDLPMMISSVPSLIEQLGKALNDLASHEDASIDKDLIKDIEGHFRNLEASVVNKSLELEIREKAFKEQESDAHLLIASREADITAREQNLWDHLQELKDAAVSAIAAARGDHQVASLEHTDVEDSKDIEDLRRNAQGKGGNSGNAEELAAVKAIVQCIRDYKLEAEYPLDPLLRRVAQLEKAISNDKDWSKSNDKKRHSGSGKHQQFKRPRAIGGMHVSTRPANVLRQPPSSFVERATYAGLPDKYTYLSASYDNRPPSQATYSQQSYEQTSYYYPADEGITATSYTAPLSSTYASNAGGALPTADASSYTASLPSSYVNYAGSGTPTAHQPYM